MTSPLETTDFAAPIPKSNLRQQVTAWLMTAIFQGRFRSGQRLIVQQIADACHASPTPIREALVELAHFGLVDLLPNRGAVVQPFGPREVIEISEVRRLLEIEAARCAFGRISDSALEGLERELLALEIMPHDEDRDRRSRDVDTQLHALIAQSCGSRRLAAEIGRYLTLIRALRDLSHQRDALNNFARSNDVPEHLAIVAAMRRSDAEAAARSMDRHIRSTARTLVEVCFSSRQPAADVGGAGDLADGLDFMKKEV